MFNPAHNQEFEYSNFIEDSENSFTTNNQNSFIPSTETGTDEAGNVDAVFYRTDPLFSHKFGNMAIFRYIHFVAQETRIIRKLFIF